MIMLIVAQFESALTHHTPYAKDNQGSNCGGPRMGQ